MAKRLAVRAHLLLLFVISMLSASCGTSEQVILITARASGSNPTVIETVVIRVIPTASTAAPVNSDSNPVHRTIQEINGDQPIRVAVHVHDSMPVLVHITAITAGNTFLYATRCYDPGGVLRDEVLLVPTDAADDADQDGWPAAAHIDATCRDPGAGTNGVACDVGLCPATVAGDCNDMPATTSPVDCTMAAFQSTGPCIYPGARAVCGDGIDQDCRANGLPGGSRDEACGDMDGDGVDACGPAGGVCDCDDNDAMIHPGATDVCGNGVDEDCSGEPGGMGAFCDADGDTYPSNVDCDDTNPDVHPGGLALEHCTMMGTECLCDGIDNNCNGLTDEDASCQSPDLDGDGHDACAAGVTDCASCDCNDCDSGIHPGATELCGNGVDEDGVGGDMPCAAGDTDRDGYVMGQDCGEGDAHVHLDAAENCNTTTSESCGTMSCPASVDADSDGFAAASVAGTDCDDTDDMVNAWATETCNGVDDNCNGDADEVLDPTNQSGCVTDPSCPGGARCTVHFDTNIHHCGGCRHECNPGTTLVADACVADACSCTTNPGGAACAVGDTCCGTTDSMGNPVAFPGCFDTDTSTQNCGGCGNVCDPTTADSCSGGRCVCGATGAACSVGQTCCGGQCVDLATDTLHCGRCDRQCGARTACTAGSCGCDDPTTHGDCNPVDIGMPGGNGCETDLLTDANFCGTCAQSCLDEHVATGSCSAGACVIGTCAASFADCSGGAANGCETDVSTITNCGSCGVTCNPMHANPVCMPSGSTFVCGYGTCMSACDLNGNRVDGCEVALSTTTCGATCGTNCTSTVVNVPAGQISCGGAACTYSGACSAGACDTNGNRADGCEVTQSPTTCGATCSTNCNTTVRNVPAGTATCGGGTCSYSGTCSAGACDVNGNRADGCEVTQSVTTCGAGCTTNCTSTVRNVPGASIMCGGAACTYTGACSAGACDVNGNRADGCEVTQSVTTCGASCSTNCNSTVVNVPAASIMCGGASCTYTGGCSAGSCDANGNRADGCEVTQSVMTCGATCGINCLSTVANVPMGQISCGGAACSYTGACSSGFCDVNGNRTDGCEVTQSTTACGATCSTNCTSTVLHVPAGQISCGGAACTYSGSCAATFCDVNGNRADGCEVGQSPTTCGGTCSTNCTTTVQNVPMANITCSSMTCGYSGSCSTGFCDADGMTNNGCEGTQSPSACGTDCATDCTMGFMHGTAGCAGNACTVASCMGSFANCDGSAANGCELMTAHDDADCCGAMCTGGTHCMGSATAGYGCM